MDVAMGDKQSDGLCTEIRFSSQLGQDEEILQAHLPHHTGKMSPRNCELKRNVQTYLFGELTGMSVSHRERVKSILSSFAEWLIDEAFITRNPTRGRLWRRRSS